MILFNAKFSKIHEVDTKMNVLKNFVSTSRDLAVFVLRKKEYN